MPTITTTLAELATLGSGAGFRLELSTEIYPIGAIAAIGEADPTIDVRVLSEHRAMVSFAGGNADERRRVGEFLNSLLERAVRTPSA